MSGMHLIILVSLVLLNTALREPQILTFCFWVASILVFALYFKTALMDPGYWPSVNSVQKPVGRAFRVLVEDGVPLGHENIPTIKDESMPAARDYTSVGIKIESEMTAKDPDENANNISRSRANSGDAESAAVSANARIRWCTYCRLPQPYRTKHCRDCDKCVALFDHHCPWIGGCVGQNNRIYFFWYIFFQCIELWLAVYFVRSN